MDYNLLSYFVHEIILARILEWVAISFSGDETHGSAAPALTDRFFTTEPPGLCLLSTTIVL